MQNDLIFILKNVEWKSRKQKEKGYRNKRESIHKPILHAREPYTDFICMTEGKNSEASCETCFREKEDSAYHYPKKDD